MKIYGNRYQHEDPHVVIMKKFLGKDIWVRCTDAYSDSDMVANFVKFSPDHQIVYYYRFRGSWLDGLLAGYEDEASYILSRLRHLDSVTADFIDALEINQPLEIYTTEELKDMAREVLDIR